MKNSLSESNRGKHLVGIAIVAYLTYVLLAALFCGNITWQLYVVAAYVCVGVSAAMEFKDVHHANGDSKPITQWDWSAWDWLDIVFGMLGWLAVSVILYVLCLIF